MLYKVFLMAFSVLLGLITACSSNPLAAFQPEINNAQNNFQFQATGMKNVTTTMNYNWQNTGTMANINQACSMGGGSGMLTIFDAAGVQVYSRNLADNGTIATTTGAAGTWVIRVTMTGLSGTVNFRAQKP
jgi:hypothetical protein